MARSRIKEASYLGKGSLFYVTGDLLYRSFGLITMPIITRYLTPGEFGITSV